MQADSVSIHPAEMLDAEDTVSESVQNGGPSSRPADDSKSPRSRKNTGRKRKTRKEESDLSSSDSDVSSSESSSSGDSSSSEAESDDSDSRTVRSVVSETISCRTEYERFDPAKKKLSNDILSNSQLNYAKVQFTQFVLDNSVEENILKSAPIPDVPFLKCKQMDEYVAPIFDKLNVEQDKGAEKGVLGIQKRIFRTMGLLSALWKLLDNIRVKSRDHTHVDEVDVAHMCQLIEKTVCCLGQASLVVERHRRINTLLKLTEDYKKSKDLLDKNDLAIRNSEEFLFGEGFKKALKKASKTQDEASEIANGFKNGRRNKRNKNKRRKRDDHSRGTFKNVKQFVTPFHHRPSA